MAKVQSWQCACGRYAQLECDWPGAEPDTFCAKPICLDCARRTDGKDYCPFHRGDPPDVAARKMAEEKTAALTAGETEAAKAAAMFGLKKVGDKYE